MVINKAGIDYLTNILKKQGGINTQIDAKLEKLHVNTLILSLLSNTNSVISSTNEFELDQFSKEIYTNSFEENLIESKKIQNQIKTTQLMSINIIDFLLDDNIISELHKIKMEEYFRPFKVHPIISIENIDFLSICTNTPSYLNDKKILVYDDFKLYLEIICQLYGLDKEIDDDIICMLENTVVQIVQDQFYNNS